MQVTRLIAAIVAIFLSYAAMAQPRADLAEATSGEGGLAAILWTFGYIAIGVAGWLFFKHTNYRQRETLAAAFWTVLLFAAVVSIALQFLLNGRVDW